jgi:hypothetical protein
MLDVYQVQGIVKQAQAEFRQKFEQDNPDIVEFLAEKITEKAKLGETSMSLQVTHKFTKKYLELHPEDDRFISQEDYAKYLTFKGFYVRKSIALEGADYALEISWPKG